MSIITNGRILITGGAGLIGSHIIDELLHAGATDIVVLDNFSRGRRENLGEALPGGRVRIVEGDIRNPRDVEGAMAGVSLVFHLAAIRITQCAEEPRLAKDVLVDGTFNVLEACVQAKVREGRRGLVGVGLRPRRGVSHRRAASPVRQPHALRRREDVQRGVAAQLQRDVRPELRRAAALQRLRPAHGHARRLHGSPDPLDGRDRRRPPPTIFGDGTQTMDFVHVTDVAKASVLAAMSPATDVVFNVGTGVETSLNDLAHKLLAVMGSTLEPQHAEARKVNPVPRRVASIEAAARVLGFRAAVGLEDGLRDLVGWWRQRAGDCEFMIPLSRPEFGDAEARAVADVLKSGWVSQGPKVAEFESLVAARVGAAYGVATTSCTTALHLALVASGVGPGDEVICPSYSFIATANAVVYAGATPVFADIEADTWNLDPADVAQRVSGKTKAILAVHQVGLAADLDRLKSRGARRASRSSRTPPARSGPYIKDGRSARPATSRASAFTRGRPSRSARAAW